MQPIVAIYLLWGVWILTWLAAAAGTHYPPRKLSGFQNFIYRMTALVATLLLFTITPWPGFDVQYRLWDRALAESWSWVLVGIAFLGFGLAWWATVHRIAVHRRHKDVVDNGPYAIVRHPIYVGLIVTAFATAVMFGRPSSMIGAVVLTIAFVVKILIEDQALREENYAYDDYIGRVPMLVPFFPTRDRPVRHAHVPPVTTMAEKPGSGTTPESGPTPFVSELIPISTTIPQTETPVQDDELEAELGLEPQPVTTKPVQLALLLDDPKSTEATDRESPRDPSNSELRPTSAV